MGQFDDAVKESVPNNDFIKPLAIAAGALILGHFFGGNKQEAQPASVPQPAPGAPPAPYPQTTPQPGSASAGGGLLGSLGGLLAGLATGGTSNGAGGPIPNSAVSSGLDNLLNQFRNAGHSQAADSWVGTGQNQPISAEQINSVIGHGKIAEIAKAAGVDPAQLSQILAQSLPNLIDKLTPGGKIHQA
jgi:uncharacterized protein YidB (DUF937 family)